MPLKIIQLRNEFGEIVAVEASYSSTLAVTEYTMQERLAELEGLRQCIERYENPVVKQPPMFAEIDRKLVL